MRISLSVVVLALLVGLGGCSKKDDATNKPAADKPATPAAPVAPTPVPKPKPTAEECTRLQVSVQLAVMGHTSTNDILADVVAWHQSHLEDMVAKITKAKGTVDAPLQTALDTATAYKAPSDAATAAWTACGKALEDKAKDAGALCQTAQTADAAMLAAWDKFSPAVRAVKMPDDKAVAESAEMLGTADTALGRSRGLPPMAEMMAKTEGCD